MEEIIRREAFDRIRLKSFEVKVSVGKTKPFNGMSMPFFGEKGFSESCISQRLSTDVSIGEVKSRGLSPVQIGPSRCNVKPLGRRTIYLRWMNKQEETWYSHEFKILPDSYFDGHSIPFDIALSSWDTRNAVRVYPELLYSERLFSLFAEVFECAYYLEDPRNALNKDRGDLQAKYFDLVTKEFQVLIFVEEKANNPGTAWYSDFEDQAHRACSDYMAENSLKEVYAMTLVGPTVRLWICGDKEISLWPLSVDERVVLCELDTYLKKISTEGDRVREQLASLKQWLSYITVRVTPAPQRVLCYEYLRYPARIRANFQQH